MLSSPFPTLKASSPRTAARTGISGSWQQVELGLALPSRSEPRSDVPVGEVPGQGIEQSADKKEVHSGLNLPEAEGRMQSDFPASSAGSRTPAWERGCRKVELGLTWGVHVTATSYGSWHRVPGT